MAPQVEPAFLVAWVRAELEASGEPLALDQRAARAVAEGLALDEAELDAAADLAARRGLLAALEAASGVLQLCEVREARGTSERLLRSRPASCVAWLRPSPGAAERLALLARALARDPSARIAELSSPLGGSPGCSAR